MQLRWRTWALCAASLTAAIFAGTALAANPEGLISTRTTPADYTPGGTIEVQVTLSRTGTGILSALGLRETLPTGWSYASTRGISGAAPAITPSTGTTGLLEFAWIDVPALPYTFAYTLSVPADAVGDATLSGQAEYRSTGPQELSDVASVTIPQHAAAAACDLSQQGFFAWFFCIIAEFFRQLFGLRA